MKTSIDKQQLERIKSLKERSSYLEQELAQLKQLIFGRKSEKFIGVPPNQFCLGLDADENPVEPVEKKITYQRKKPDSSKSKPIRIPVPDHLPFYRQVQMFKRKQVTR